MTGGGLLGVVGALCVVLGVLALAVHVLRRLQGLSLAPGRGVPLQVLQRVSVGPKQGVALLRVADRVLVVSVADVGASLLTELDGEARTQALGAGTPAAEAPPAPVFRLPLPEGMPAPWRRRPRRAGWLARLPLGALLLALALPCAARDASAQTSPAPASRQPVLQVPATPAPAGSGLAVTGPLPPRVDIQLGEGRNALRLEGAVGLVVMMAVLTLLPALFLLMTSFTRILIVLHFLRSALGTQTTPPGQLLTAMAVLLTGVVMNPTLQEVNRTALQPYFDGQLQQAQAYQVGVQPFREFMLRNVRESDLAMFAEIAGVADADSIEALPTVVVVSAFVTSELRTAFQMGFVIFLPFMVIDIIVASVLMSLGMFMLPPMMISLPLKLLLFVLADGWTLVVQNLVASFR